MNLPSLTRVPLNLKAAYGRLAAKFNKQSVNIAGHIQGLPLPKLTGLAEAQNPPVCFTKGAVGQGAVDASCFGLTHIGSGKRSGNEDSLILDKGLLLVCDGMGGHSNGEIASHLASRITYFCLKLNLPFALAISVAHRAILDFNQAHNDKGGSTFVGAKIIGSHAHVFHVGDSRAYLFQAKTGQLLQLTVDHSLAYDHLRQTNDLFKSIAAPLSETMQEAIETANAGFSMKNVILRTMGMNKIDPSFIKQRLGANDILLLCSDGLSEPLACLKLKTIINSALLKGASLQQIAEDLLAGCLATGLADDNITVALFRQPLPRGLLGHIKNWLPF